MDDAVDLSGRPQADDGAVTAGWRKVQPIATSPGVQPFRFPIVRSNSTNSRLRVSLGS